MSTISMRTVGYKLISMLYFQESYLRTNFPYQTFSLTMEYLLFFFAISALAFAPSDGRSALTDEEADEPILDLNKLGPDIYGYPDEKLGETLENLQESNFNPEEIGNYYEGDILYPRSKQRNGLANESFRWKNGVVPIEMRGLFSKYFDC